MMLTLDSVSFCTSNLSACRSGLAVPVVSFLILVLRCPGTSSSRDNNNGVQGSYAELKDSICQPCGPGTVQPDAAKTSCNLCPVGQVPDSERTKCVPCGEVSGPDVEQFVALIHAGTLSNFELYVIIGVYILDKDRKWTLNFMRFFSDIYWDGKWERSCRYLRINKALLNNYLLHIWIEPHSLLSGTRILCRGLWLPR